VKGGEDRPTPRLPCGIFGLVCNRVASILIFMCTGASFSDQLSSFSLPFTLAKVSALRAGWRSRERSRRWRAWHSVLPPKVVRLSRQRANFSAIFPWKLQAKLMLGSETAREDSAVLEKKYFNLLENVTLRCLVFL